MAADNKHEIMVSIRQNFIAIRIPEELTDVNEVHFGRQQYCIENS